MGSSGAPEPFLWRALLAADEEFFFPSASAGWQVFLLRFALGSLRRRIPVSNVFLRGVSWRGSGRAETGPTSPSPRATRCWGTPTRSNESKAGSARKEDLEVPTGLARLLLPLLTLAFPPRTSAISLPPRWSRPPSLSVNSKLIGSNLVLLRRLETGGGAFSIITFNIDKSGAPVVLFFREAYFFCALDSRSIGFR